VLVVVYLANLAYTLVTHRDVFASDEASEPAEWSLATALGVLVGATAMTAWEAEIVSGALEPTAERLGITTFFLGVTVLAVIGNAAEYFSAVYFARRNHMGLVMTTTVGSTIQVALLVAPILVLGSWAMGRPMNLVFANPLELVAIAGTTFAVDAIAQDGEATWFEGVLLLAVYVLFAIAFFFVTP
jgi:Ca2+:H+ antiporter